MKTPGTFILIAIVALSLASAAVLRAGDNAAAKPKPYPLDTCIVSGEKLGADPKMKTYTFVHEGQEIKLCCKGCLKTFQKDPAGHLKKMEKSDKKK